MAYLLDTSILARLANQADPLYAVPDGAVAKLFLAGETLHLTPQNLIEFRSVATRPKAANGLGLSASEAAAKAAVFEASFTLLPDTTGVFRCGKAWSASSASSASRCMTPDWWPSATRTR